MLDHAGPILKDVVLVGAGHAHVQILKRFGMKPVPGLRITMITREVHTPYSGMLPGLICGYYSFDETHIDTGPLARLAGARLYQSVVTGIDREARVVLCNNRPPVPYDILSIDIGSVPTTNRIPGAAENAISVKPIDGFLGRFDAMLGRTLEAKAARHIAVVGGGAAGVELVLAVRCRLMNEMKAAGRDPGGLAFTLVSATGEILPAFPQKFRERFAEILKECGVHVVAGSPVTQVGRGVLQFETRAPLDADEILWTTAAQPPLWLRETGLPLDNDGFIKVSNTLQVEGTGNTFAAGDVITFGPRALPKSGVYSVRSGPVLAENIRRLALGKKLKTFKPQRDAMYLLTTGEKSAVGARGKIVFGGKWVWRWKNRIDRRFMAVFNDIPDLGYEDDYSGMPVVDANALRELGGGMRCGGCGAKVGAGALGRALASIHPVKRPEVLAGLDAGEDATVIDLGNDLLQLQSVDYFRAMIDDPFTFGQIAANHALNDIYAMGGNPETALAIVTVPHGLEAKTEADLSALLTGANEVLAEAGCQLTGGHTAEGAEMGLGFAVTGVVPRERVLRKGGAQPGDLLVLTKPLGTGTLLAADMRGQAKARWIMGAIAHMLVPNRSAVGTLMRHGVHAATDVTGFGLLGHLAEMLRASRTAAVLKLDALRVLPGATRTLEEGYFSSLYPQNLRMRRIIRQAENIAHPLYPVLFDPQTAGGLLAAVPRGTANAVMTELTATGYPRASIIGEIVPWDGAPEMVSLRL